MAITPRMVIAIHKMAISRNFINKHSYEIKTSNLKESVIPLEIFENKREKWERN